LATAFKVCSHLSSLFICPSVPPQGNDIEKVGESCALIHQSCLVKRKDIRKFLDGMLAPLYVALLVLGAITILAGPSEQFDFASSKCRRPPSPILPLPIMLIISHSSHTLAAGVYTSKTTTVGDASE